MVHYLMKCLVSQCCRGGLYSQCSMQAAPRIVKRNTAYKPFPTKFVIDKANVCNTLCILSNTNKTMVTGIWIVGGSGEGKCTTKKAVQCNLSSADLKCV